MSKKTLLFIFAGCLLTAVSVFGQEKKFMNVVSDVKFSGYAMTQYQASDQENAENNSFNIRLARLSLDGKAFDNVIWKVQLQFNGNTDKLSTTPKVVDIFAEWQPKDYFKVKAGQFKRPFTFENPMNPIDQGFMSYAQNIMKLSGFSDRTGEHSSNGRDLGVQLQGDFLKNSNGRNLVHYQVGVFNGQGINVKDVDNRKDIIGGLWVMPVKGMRIGAFGWTGSYARKGNWTDAAGQAHVNEVRSLGRNRYALSAELVKSDWTIRSEYIHSQGLGFKTTYNTSANTSDCAISGSGDKADGLYALCIAPVVKKKFHVKARYDMYRSNGEWNSAKTQYELGADYVFTKNLQLNLEYVRVNDRTLTKHNYNMVDVELDFRF